jgi:hypothetical protein
MVVAGLLELRAAEIQARSQITVEAERKGFSADDAERTFLIETTKIVGGRAGGIIQSLSGLTTDNPRQKRESAFGFDYLSASTLMALALFWLDVAEQMMRNGIVGFDPFALDFIHLEFEGVENIFDVLSSAYRLYDRVARFLRTVGPQNAQAAARARDLASQAKDDARRFSAEADRLAADAAERSRALAADAANNAREAAEEARMSDAKALAAKEESMIASLNMVGVQSLALEIRELVINHNCVIDGGFNEPPFDRIDVRELNRAAELIDGCYRDHMLICRNLLYMALQVDEKPLADKMTRHIADVLEISREEVATTPIWGRPLSLKNPLSSKS